MLDGALIPGGHTGSRRGRGCCRDAAPAICDSSAPLAVPDQYTSVRLQVDRITASATPTLCRKVRNAASQPLLAERHLFAQRDRRGLMVDAEDVECHGSALARSLKGFWWMKHR